MNTLGSVRHWCDLTMQKMLQHSMKNLTDLNVVSLSSKDMDSVNQLLTPGSIIHQASVSSVHQRIPLLGIRWRVRLRRVMRACGYKGYCVFRCGGPFFSCFAFPDLTWLYAAYDFHTDPIELVILRVVAAIVIWRVKLE